MGYRAQGGTVRKLIRTGSVFIKVGNAWHSTLLPTPPKIGDSYSILKLSAY